MNNVKHSKQYPDAVIIEKILEGETALFEILIRRYNPFLYKTGMSYGYTHADTQDLMQETFISAYLNLMKFENRSTFKTWIIRIMLNNCFQKRHRSGYKLEIKDKYLINEKSIPMHSSYQEPDTTKTLIDRELAVIIEHSLLQIPMDYRLVFSLRQMSGLDVAETAEVLNITESNVKTRLHRAKSMLRKEIEKKYSPEDIFEFNLIYCDAVVHNVLDKIKQHSEKK